jgi:hypothetical protein
VKTIRSRAITTVRRAPWRILRVLVERIACRDPRGVPAGNAPRITLVSCSNGRHHGLDAKDVEGPS